MADRLADFGVTLDMKDQLLKKHSAIFNSVLRQLKNERPEIPMYVILLGLHEHLDLDWVVQNLLNDANRTLIRDEMIEHYKIQGEAKSSAADLDMFS